MRIDPMWVGVSPSEGAMSCSPGWHAEHCSKACCEHKAASVNSCRECGSFLVMFICARFPRRAVFKCSGRVLQVNAGRRFMYLTAASIEAFLSHCAALSLGFLYSRQARPCSWPAQLMSGPQASLEHQLIAEQWSESS